MASTPAFRKASSRFREENKVTLNTQGDGIQATNDVDISGGTFDITTFGGYTKAKALEQADESAKGAKSDTDVSISGRAFTLNTPNDAVHSNGNLTMTGGSFVIRAGDDAIHADNDVSVAGADVNVATYNEGIEGARVYLETKVRRRLSKRNRLPKRKNQAKDPIRRISPLRMNCRKPSDTNRQPLLRLSLRAFLRVKPQPHSPRTAMTPHLPCKGRTAPEIRRDNRLKQMKVGRIGRLS